MRYILPDVAWTPLLQIIVREAPSGAVLEVHTGAMQAVAEAAVQAVGRTDLTIQLKPALPAGQDRAA